MRLLDIIPEIINKKLEEIFIGKTVSLPICMDSNAHTQYDCVFKCTKTKYLSNGLIILFGENKDRYIIGLYNEYKIIYGNQN